MTPIAVALQARTLTAAPFWTVLKAPKTRKWEAAALAPDMTSMSSKTTALDSRTLSIKTRRRRAARTTLHLNQHTTPGELASSRMTLSTTQMTSEAQRKKTLERRWRSSGKDFGAQFSATLEVQERLRLSLARLLQSLKRTAMKRTLCACSKKRVNDSRKRSASSMLMLMIWRV